MHYDRGAERRTVTAGPHGDYGAGWCWAHAELGGTGPGHGAHGRAQSNERAGGPNPWHQQEVCNPSSTSVSSLFSLHLSTLLFPSLSFSQGSGLLDRSGEEEAGYAEFGEEEASHAQIRRGGGWLWQNRPK